MAADLAAAHLVDFIGFLAPQVGLEPTTLRLTAECSAIELLRSVCAPSGAVASLRLNAPPNSLLLSSESGPTGMGKMA